MYLNGNAELRNTENGTFADRTKNVTAHEEPRKTKAPPPVLRERGQNERPGSRAARSSYMPMPPMPPMPPMSGAAGLASPSFPSSRSSLIWWGKSPPALQPPRPHPVRRTACGVLRAPPQRGRSPATPPSSATRPVPLRSYEAILCARGSRAEAYPLRSRMRRCGPGGGSGTVHARPRSR